jgi:rRNA-processing protein FCF1
MNILIIILLLVIAAEVTYLLSQQTKRVSKSGRMVFVDTSVLIDGRILAVAQSGFIGDRLFIPRSVIGELQFLADNADADKRSRARHGLDVVSELQKLPQLKIEIFQDGSKAEEGVDERLLNLAKKYSGAICTIDYNLNKVAQVEKITVLNVNDLAMSLRMAYLPGEKILLELTQKGQDAHQAIGHLTDGTMVVVEHAHGLIGKTVEIEFIRSLQTAAGKMMFAKLVEGKKPNLPRTQTPKPTRTFVPKKQQVVVPELPQPAPVVPFHSDRNDQRLANNNTRPRRQDASTTPTQSTPRQPRQPQQSRQNAAPKRPRSSAQNEEDLIRMLNNQ